AAKCHYKRSVHPCCLLHPQMMRVLVLALAIAFVAGQHVNLGKLQPQPESKVQNVFVVL
ncbi:hypothetical protein AALO_G00079300, partial [Alosa alosa]